MRFRALAILGMGLCTACSSSESGTQANPSQPDGGGQDATAEQGPITKTPETTAKGTSTGAVEKKSVGAAGGTVSSADGRLTLTIPPGALAADTEYGVEPITNLAFGAVGAAYRITPDGTTFSKPATVTFKVDDTELTNSNLAGLWAAFQDAEGFWNLVPEASSDEGAKTITVETTHLTDWAMVSPVLIQPLAADVKVGKTQALEIQVCYDFGKTSKGYTCDNDLAVFKSIGAWKVNGNQGGTSTLGTVSPDKASYTTTYTAPSSVPSPSTVTVSVDLGPVGGKKTDLILLSIVNVTDNATMNGTFKIDVSEMPQYPNMTFSVDGVATLTFADDGPDETNYELGGQVTISPATFSIGELVCTTSAPTHTIGSQSLFKVRKTPVVATRWSFIDGWDYTCPVPGAPPVTMTVPVQFATTTGATCTDFADVPCADANAPSGSYTNTCLTNQKVSAVWSFSKP